MADTQLTLRFHHDVIEHLGLRLYQNKPSKVICELLSNSWDADAKRVAVDTAPTGTDRPILISVMDDGIGMNRSTLQSSFLTIASPRRGKANSVTLSQGGRPLMGRKGLGKLAPFGICKRVNVITLRDGKVNWIELDLDGIAAVGTDSSDPEMARYHPSDIMVDGDRSLLPTIERDGISGSVFAQFLDEQRAESGTAIFLSRLIDRISVSVDDLKIAIGRRFTVTLARDDFRVTINESELDPSQIYPAFALRIPPTGFAVDTAGANTLKYWIGFAEKPISPNSEAGVGVYAHGKLAQERPFHFQIKGNDLVLPYMYGVVEADWIDEVSEDLISTDRSTVDWAHPVTQHLLAWGQKRIRDWINRYQEYRASTERHASREFIMSEDADKRIKAMTSAEKESLITILSEITPVLPPTPETRASVTEALTDAWLHKPARDMINKLWARFKDADQGGDSIGEIIQSIREYLVPEALSSTVTLSQRAFALTILHDLIHNGVEPDLQKLIEAFPWIIGPEGEYLSANQPLRKVVEEAEKDGRLTRQSDKSEAPVKDSLKPDFVFLSNSKADEIIVVEIKSPLNELTIENREQLHSYMTFLEHKYSKAKLSGILVGNSSGGITLKNVDMSWMSWHEVFYRAKAAYTDIIASMISGYADSSKTLRMTEIEFYGGAEIWATIQKLAQNDSHLNDLITEFGKQKNSSTE